MVASKIFALYASVWEPLLNTDITGSDIIEFSKKLPKLRAALSCSVCNQLLINRETLCPLECRVHFVCKACLGKERDDDKKCEGCEDWRGYAEDDTLTCLIKSYQDFCLFFLTSKRIVRVLEVKHEIDPKFDPFQLIDLVREGIKGCKRLKRRKPCPAVQNQEPAPVETERNTAKTPAIGVRADANKNIQPSVSTETTTKKGEVRKSVSDGIEQEKIAKLKCKPTSNTVTTNKIVTPTTTFSSTKPLGSIVKSSAAATFKSQTTPSTSAGTSTSAKSTEPLKAGVTSPPLVTIKVEVQTTPEKQQSPLHNDGNESPNSLNAFPTLDSLQDPLAEPVRPPSRPPVSRPLGTSVATPMTASICTTPSLASLPYKITSTPVVSSQSNLGPQIIQIAHPTGIKTVSIRPQQIRLAGIPGRIPMQIFGTVSGTSSSNTITDSIRMSNIAKGQAGLPTTSTTTAPQVKRRIIFTTATPHDLQRWPDPNKVLQFSTSDLSRFPGLAGIRPGIISVSHASCPMTGLRTTSAANIRPVATASTLPLVRPPNATAVLTTSSSPLGQTIFSSNSNPGMQTHSTSPNLPFVRSVVVPTTSAASVGSATLRPQGFTTASSSTTVTSQVPVSSSSTTSTNVPAKRKPEGCRCGNATPTPGKLTCIGQRCACYADRNACSDCKCKGCKNPYVPGSGGKKVLHGVRTFIDPQTNQTIPIIATPVGHGPNNSTVLSGNANSTVTQTNPSLVTAVGPSPTFATIQTGVSSSMPQPVPPFQFIPVRFGPNGTPQYLQITNPQALQQMPIILSTSGHLQANHSSGITIQGIPVSGLSAAGIHHVSQLQQPRIQQMNMKPDRNSQQE